MTTTMTRAATSQAELLDKLNHDLKESANSLGIDEVRFLVDMYYDLQDIRIGTGHQNRQLELTGEPHELLSWFAQNFAKFERNIKSALDEYTDSSELGLWCKSITGIGPVLSAGLIAHIDITKAPTVGHIWRYAGLDPTSIWEPKTKRPWNAQLKSLCYKIGESFVKFQNHPDDQYGHFYVERKAIETRKNNAGEFADQAATALKTRNYRTTTDAYKAYKDGRLPQAQIHARARRWTVKLFLAHYHETAYKLHYGAEPAKPYAISILGHADYIPAP